MSKRPRKKEILPEPDTNKRQKSNDSSSITRNERIEIYGKNFDVGDSIRIDTDNKQSEFAKIQKIYSKDNEIKTIGVSFYYTPNEIECEKPEFLNE